MNTGQLHEPTQMVYVKGRPQEWEWVIIATPLHGEISTKCDHSTRLHWTDSYGVRYKQCSICRSMLDTIYPDAPTERFGWVRRLVSRAKMVRR